MTEMKTHARVSLDVSRVGQPYPYSMVPNLQGRKPGPCLACLPERGSCFLLEGDGACQRHLLFHG